MSATIQDQAQAMLDEAIERGREGDDILQYTRDCAADLYGEKKAEGAAPDLLEAFDELCERELGSNPSFYHRD